MYVPFIQLFVLAIGLGVYILLVSEIAAKQEWSNFLLSIVFLAQTISMLLAFFVLNRTARFTVYIGFYKLFGIFMAVVTSLALMFYESVIFWVLFSCIKGVANVHFYHGIRMRIVSGLSEKLLMRFFSLEYIILSMGAIIGVSIADSINSVAAIVYIYMLCYVVVSFVAVLEDKFGKFPQIKVPDSIKIKEFIRVVKTVPLPASLCFLGGVLGESFYGFVIKIHLDSGFSESFSAHSYNLLLLGSVLLQYPLAHWQDFKPKMSITLSAFMAIACFYMFSITDDMLHIAVILFLLGGVLGALSVVGDSLICIIGKENISVVLQAGPLFYILGISVADPIIGLLLDLYGKFGLSAFFIIILMIIIPLTLIGFKDKELSNKTS